MLLLIDDPEPERPERPEPGAARRLPTPPWQPVAWFAAFCWMLFLAGAIGGFAGYLIVLAAVAMGCWRIDRWLARQYWGGLREVQR